ncbi:MAG: choice-of-anchor V domain-containing protein [Bryobacterales bacterium]|nr:choice-of-anchor V domain-containing protein [Bryobacterales bacterium]
MGRKRRILFCVIGAAIPVLLYAYSTGPPPGKTAAPGEGICRDCHSVGGSGGGKVEIGFPGGMAYTPGVRQQLTVTITDADAQWYGFELSARLAADNSQAGGLAPAPGESNIRVICSDNRPRTASGCPSNAPIEYIQHSPARQTNTFRIEWTPPATDRGPVRIYVAANAANGNGDPTGDDIYAANYTLTPAGGSPGPSVSAQNGVMNGASFLPPIAAGSWATIKGTNLAPATRTWRSDEIVGGRLPTQLDGVGVTINNKPAAVYYISPTQLNVQAPTDDAVGPVEVKVTTPQGASGAVMGQLQSFAPGFFMFDPQGRKYLAAVHADGTFLGPPNLFQGVTTRPAVPGETILLFGTGFGPTNPAVPAGQVVPQPSALTNQVQIRLGNVLTNLSFAGLAAQAAGLYQFNVVVPEVADGDVPVVAEIGGARSQDNAFIAVQRPSQGAATGIQVFYRLDPWLVSNNYQGELWASPAVLGPATQGGPTFTLEVKTQGLDANGQPVDINAQWIPADPGMVTVSPSQGNQVRLTVQRAGQSSLRAVSQGVSKELVIKATYQGDALLVEIAQ